MDAIKEMNELKFDHTKDTLKESFGITEETDQACFKLVEETRKNVKSMSEVVDKIWNCDYLPLNARVYAIFKYGQLESKIETMDYCAKTTAKLLSRIIK